MDFRTAALFFGLVILLSSSFHPAFGGKGGKTHGDSCNIVASGVQVWDSLTGGQNNFAEACDLEKGLVCAINKCSCPTGSNWEQNVFEQISGLGGQCTSGAKGLGAVGLLSMTLVAIVTTFIPKLFQ